MSVILAIPFLLLMFVPWIVVLVVPLATLMVSGAYLMANLGGVFATVRTVEALQPGLLALVGLDREPSLEDLVRGAIGRVLGFAPAGSRPAACACIKPAGQSYVGVLRIWNARGDYALRTPGDSIAAVANGIVEQLRIFGDRFPAREGAARVRIHECDPRTCPLRQIRAMARPQMA